MAISQVELQSGEPEEVKRFQETIESYQRRQVGTVQEELITLRARLAIAQKRLVDLDTRPAGEQEGHLKRPLEMKALKAEIDHYIKKIERIESSILQKKRTERERAIQKRKK